jgi:hypothetical protein
VGEVEEDVAITQHAGAGSLYRLSSWALQLLRRDRVRTRLPECQRIQPHHRGVVAGEEGIILGVDGEEEETLTVMQGDEEE